jgi:oligopeptide/dipeptide ABC transporter ATP-binding protein
VLIADEPTTALDVTIQAQLLELLKREQQSRNMAVIMITHDLGVVAGIADRVAVMYAGRIVEEALTDRLFSAPTHPYTRGLLAAVPRIDGPLHERLSAIPGAPPAIADIPRGCPFRGRCAYVVDRCALEDPPLRTREPDHGTACWADLPKVAS